MEDRLAPLTAEERDKLEGQADRIAALLAELDSAMVENGINMAQALAAYGQARIDLEQLKAEKSMLTERARNLKTLLQSFPRPYGSYSL